MTTMTIIKNITMHYSVCPSSEYISPFVRLTICPSVRQSVSLSVCPSVRLSVCLTPARSMESCSGSDCSVATNRLPMRTSIVLCHRQRQEPQQHQQLRQQLYSICDSCRFIRCDDASDRKHSLTKFHNIIIIIIIIVVVEFVIVNALSLSRSSERRRDGCGS